VKHLLARNISYSYGSETCALTDVSIRLEPGDFLCVLGPNGAGKSTLLKLLGGLLLPDSGIVQHAGENLRALLPRERARHVGVVPQFLSRIPDIRVDDFVLGGRYGHLDRWRRTSSSDHVAVRTAMEQADIGDLGQRALPTLSGGQRRRVMVARALAQEARFLLVDEPTAELDPEHQLSVFSLLQRLAANGHGILVVTHDLNLASQFASRVHLLAEGQTIAEGDVHEVLTSEVLSSTYRASFRCGTWPAADGQPRPYAVPWQT
jgi:iron complex transport system ATP-binding protein